MGGGIIKAVFCFIYSFHMPLFVFVSGYFSKNLEKRRKAAFSGLLIPYIIAQIIIGLIVVLVDRNLNVLWNPLFASYGTWYLISLYIWRTLMPELVKVKKLMVFAVLAFFVTPFFWGMDNTLGLQRTIGFFCFFLAGYYCSEKDVLKIIKIPKTVCIVIFVIEITVLYVCFDVVGISHLPVFSIFVHGLTISEDLWKIPFVVGGYVVAFALAIFNSLLFLNLFYRENEAKSTRALAKIGEDTMPLYLTHLALIKIFAAFMRPLPDVAYWILSIPVGATFVIGLSSEKYRKVFDQVMKRIKSIILTEPAA